jgi:hypothetical protein
MTGIEWLAPKIELLTLNLNAGQGRFCSHYPVPQMLVSLRKPRDAACEECAVDVHYPPEVNPRCDRCERVCPSLVEDMVWNVFVLPTAPVPGAVEWRLLVNVCLECAALDGFEAA